MCSFFKNEDTLINQLIDSINVNFTVIIHEYNDTNTIVLAFILLHFVEFGGVTVLNTKKS